MPERPVGVADAANADGVAEVSVIEAPSPLIVTTTTADPGTAGTSLAVTLRDLFPQSGNFKIRVEGETMRVTAGHGTGAGSFTVVRGIDGSTAAAHAIGVIVAQTVAVQVVTNVDASSIITYRGRFSTFKTPGRAAVSQKLCAIHNSNTSTVRVRVNRVKVDVLITAVKVVTIKPPVIRLCRFTAVPTNGTAMTKVPLDTRLVSNAQVTVWGDASADDTLSATTLTITIPANNVLSQVHAPRIFTAVGYELMDTHKFFEGEPDVELGPLEGLAVFLDAAVVTTGNPATDFWTASMDWDEYTVA